MRGQLSSYTSEERACKCLALEQELETLHDRLAHIRRQHEEYPGQPRMRAKAAIESHDLPFLAFVFTFALVPSSLLTSPRLISSRNVPDAASFGVGSHRGVSAQPHNQLSSTVMSPPPPDQVPPQKRRRITTGTESPGPLVLGEGSR